jgi:hypothetical protein
LLCVFLVQDLHAALAVTAAQWLHVDGDLAGLGRQRQAQYRDPLRPVGDGQDPFSAEGHHGRGRGAVADGQQGHTARYGALPGQGGRGQQRYDEA